MVSTQCLGQVLYSNFGQRRELLSFRNKNGNKTNYAEKAAAKYAKVNDAVMDPGAAGLFYDPCEPVRFAPFLIGILYHLLVHFH